MKSKMSTKGGAMGGKKKMLPGYKDGGKIRMSTKMMANGGMTRIMKKEMMNTKGNKRGGKRG